MYYRIYILVALFAAPTVAEQSSMDARQLQGSCPEVPPGGCSLCGEGRCVTNENAIFGLETCGELELRAYLGRGSCKAMIDVHFSAVCGCSSRSNRTPAPVVTSTPTPSPVISTGCPEVPSDGCSICGPGLCVGNPDAVFTLLGQTVGECGPLEQRGYNGDITTAECNALPTLVDVCECGNGGGVVTPAPVPAPTPAPIPVTPSPVESFSCPDVPEGGCSVCGPNRCITNPDVIFAFPGQPALTCAALQFAGSQGSITGADCGFLPDLIGVCGCANGTSVPVTPSCPEVPSDGCSICGPGLCVGNPEAVFSFPGQPSVPCGTLEGVGYAGVIPLDQCTALPDLVDVCECAGSADPSTPVPATPSPITPLPTTVAPVSPAPTPPTGCADVPDGGCSICGAELCIRNPDAIFSFPGQPEVPCGTLQAAGYDGLVPLSQCGFLPSLVIPACGCSADGN